MVKVQFTRSKMYKNELKKPYQVFMIEDYEKDEMVKDGAVIVEEKVVNKNKVESHIDEDKPKYNYNKGKKVY